MLPNSLVPLQNHLSYLKIESPPTSFGDLRDLEVLNLSYCNLICSQICLGVPKSSKT